MRYLLLLVSLWCFFSCQQNQPVVGRAVTDQEKNTSVMLSEKNQVIFIDSDLSDKLKIVSAKATRNDMGMLVVRAEFQTDVDENIHVDIKCKFTHKEGKVEETPWEPKIIKRHEVIGVEFTSLSPAAAEFMVYVRFTK